MDRQQVIDRVRDSLRSHRPLGVTLDVLESGIRRDNGFWYVPVKPSAPLSRTFEFYDALAAVESDLDDNQNLNVLLIPVLEVVETPG